MESLIVRIAKENRDWGYLRIEGALSNLGHHLARGTIANILKRNGIEPAPERVRKTTWKEFLTQHWDLIVAADFFTVEVWTRKGLQRFLFFIELSTRRVQIAGISAKSDGLWMSQIARNLTDAEDGVLKGKYPQWTSENRPYVDASKPANERNQNKSIYTLREVVWANIFWRTDHGGFMLT